jgi:MraZ protein
MRIFSGTYSVAIDKKGRFAIPTDHRNAIPAEDSDEIYITRGRSSCVAAYDKMRWEQFYQNIENLDLSYKEKEIVTRAFIGSLHVVPMDSSGRITIPRDLINHADLEGLKEISVVGMTDRIEIWNPKSVKDETEKNEEILQGIMESSFRVKGTGTQGTASGV